MSESNHRSSTRPDLNSGFYLVPHERLRSNTAPTIRWYSLCSPDSVPNNRRSDRRLLSCCQVTERGHRGSKQFHPHLFSSLDPSRRKSLPIVSFPTPASDGTMHDTLHQSFVCLLGNRTPPHSSGHLRIYGLITPPPQPHPLRSF